MLFADAPIKIEELRFRSVNQLVNELVARIGGG